MARKKKLNGATERIVDSVRHLGLKVDIKARKGTSKLQLETRVEVNGKSRRVRRSAKTSELEKARENAHALANAILARLTGGADLAAAVKQQRGEDLTLGDLFDVYREKRIPLLTKDHARRMQKAMGCLEATLGRDKVVAHISQLDVDHHVARRKAGGIRYTGTHRDGSTYTIQIAGGRNAGCHDDIARLSIICNWALTVKPRGVPLLAENPLNTLRLPPRERNPKRPLMNADRYGVMLAVADRAEWELRTNGIGRRGPKVLPNEPDAERSGGVPRKRSTGDHMPPGFVKLLLRVARETGHRRGAIAGLRIGDILLDRKAVREALARIGANETLANGWPFGAIYWDKKLDKQEYDRIIPISKRLRDALVEYLATRGTMDPEAPLVPSTTDPTACIVPDQMSHVFDRIEEVARDQGYELPNVSQGAWHMFRRLWRSERVGFFHDKLVAFCGGWSDGGAGRDEMETMNTCYLQFQGRAHYLCVEFDPVRDAPLDGRVPGVNVIVIEPSG
jgi:integrase